MVPKVKIDVVVTWGLADKAVEAMQRRERRQIGDSTGEADDAAL